MLQPIVQFIQTEASSGFLLMGATLVALIWANSGWASSYPQMWASEVSLRAASFELSKPLLHWINDGLMAVFFLLVGLEIKREVLLGELSSKRKAALPVAAALGGMVVPALLYALFARGTSGAAGWGIPMATDIAFALGALTLLGPRVPVGLKVFLVALAIVDDLGAVLVIAAFYTDSIHLGPLMAGAGVFALLLLLNRFGVRKLTPYVLLGVVLWFLMLKSGIHATIAGVLLAATIPTRIKVDVREYVDRTREVLDQFEQSDEAKETAGLTQARQVMLEDVAHVSEDAQMPLERLEGALHPWVTFGIVPLFALANAGVPLGEGLRQSAASPIGWGIVAGLLIGKPVGIYAMARIAVRRGWAELPEGVTWRHVLGVGVLGGIGFTMSLFVAELSLDGATKLITAKASILVASLVAGTVGFLLLRRAQPPVEPPISSNPPG